MFSEASAPSVHAMLCALNPPDTYIAVSDTYSSIRHMYCSSSRECVAIHCLSCSGRSSERVATYIIVVLAVVECVAICSSRSSERVATYIVVVLVVVECVAIYSSRSSERVATYMVVVLVGVECVA